MNDRYILYGSPQSLFTGKVRSYLRKQRLSYEERTPGHPDFGAVVVPAIGRVIVPVLVCPDGAIIQDSVDIIDHFEILGAPVTARPSGPRQLVLAHIVELYASQFMLRHAMHFRWSWRREQEDFLRDAFSSRGPAATEYMARMASYLPMLGVNEATIPHIEESYRTQLDILQAHFARHPYLFGGQASLGDFGLIGPYFAHLGRDPYPEGLMKRRAPKVFRWVERMNAPDADMPEFVGHIAGFLPDDEIPETLDPLFDLIAQEIFPEILDKLAYLADHVTRIAPEDGAPVSAKPHQRTLGNIPTLFMGAACEGGVQPYLLYLWQRVTDDFEALDPQDQTSVRAYLDARGLARLLDTERPIRVERQRHIEVWRGRS